MSEISVFRVWRDTGFTEGSVEVPKRNSTLPSPTFTFEDLQVSRDRMFSEVKVKGDFPSLMTCSYVEAVYEFNNVSTPYRANIYGWVDEVLCTSDTDGSPVTTVRWHVDHWRTWMNTAQFKDGIVKARPHSDSKDQPPQNPSYRVKERGESMTVIPSDQQYWYILITFTEQSPDGETTSSVYGYVPVDVTDGDAEFTKDGKSCPSLNSFVIGDWDEQLGLTPEMVKGVFLSPIEPSPAWSFTSQGSKAMYMSLTPLGSIVEHWYTLASPVKTDDKTTWILTGFDNESIGVLPWGLEVSMLKGRIIFESTSAYLQLRAFDKYSHVLGACFTLPLPTIEVTENSWSSYVYSGARQSDLSQRVANTSKSLESGIASTANQAIQGVGSGAMLGSIGGPLGALGGALIGGVTSALGSGISTVTDYMISSKYNDVFQGIDDFSHALQSDGLLMAGTGFDCLRFGGLPELKSIVIDDYSQELLDSRQELYGVNVDEYTSNCTTLINAGGPLRIENLTVTGAIPVQAKQYIKERFRSGVRMI